MFSIGDRGRWCLQCPDIRIGSYSPESLFARLCAAMHVWKSAMHGWKTSKNWFSPSTTSAPEIKLSILKLSSRCRCLYRLSQFANYFSYPEWYFIVFI